MRPGFSEQRAVPIDMVRGPTVFGAVIMQYRLPSRFSLVAVNFL